MVYWLHDHCIVVGILVQLHISASVGSLILHVKEEMSKKDLPPESEKIWKKMLTHRRVMVQSP